MSTKKMLVISTVSSIIALILFILCNLFSILIYAIFIGGFAFGLTFTILLADKLSSRFNNHIDDKNNPQK